MLLELGITVALVWFGLCLFVADAIETRRWRNETIARRLADYSRR